MPSIRYSFVLLMMVLSLSANALERFSSKECLEANYKTSITHKGPLFGLLTHELLVQKKNCVLTISHRKYLPKEWVIDVCREPVHIKVTSATGVDVAKKEVDCIRSDASRDTSNFCSQYFDLAEIIQDDGLIFAEGDRDSLSTPHGKTYCAYQLLKRYLFDSILFSRYTEVPDIFIDQPRPKPTPVVPAAPATPTEAAPVTAPAAPEASTKTTPEATDSAKS